jgi:hypothetical protein
VIGKISHQIGLFLILGMQAGAGAQGMVQGSAAGYKAMINKLRARQFF